MSTLPQTPARMSASGGARRALAAQAREILSPSTGRVDRGRKLADHLRLPSVEHYPIIDADEPLVIHCRRHDADFLTRMLREGTIPHDPPGIEPRLAEIYGGATT